MKHIEYYTKWMPLGKPWEETVEILSLCMNILKYPCGGADNTVPDALITIHQHCRAQCLPTAHTPAPPTTQFCETESLSAWLSAVIAVE